VHQCGVRRLSAHPTLVGGVSLAHEDFVAGTQIAGHLRGVSFLVLDFVVRSGEGYG